MKSKLVVGLRARARIRPAAVEAAATEILRRRETVSVREAKDQISALLARAEAGEESVITSDGEPKAMLVRYRPVVGGKAWRPIEAFRVSMPVAPDSTSMLREARDSAD